jgi:hypothetical protein
LNRDFNNHGGIYVCCKTVKERKSVGHRLWKNLKKNGLLIFLTWATTLLSLVKGSAPELSNIRPSIICVMCDGY